MPDYNYTVNVAVGHDSLIAVLMLDTVLLCGNSGYDFEDSEPEYHSKEDYLLAQDLFDDVETRLKKIASTDVKYIIVAGHFPVKHNKQNIFFQ